MGGVDLHVYFTPCSLLYLHKRHPRRPTNKDCRRIISFVPLTLTLSPSPLLFRCTNYSCPIHPAKRRRCQSRVEAAGPFAVQSCTKPHKERTLVIFEWKYIIYYLVENIYESVVNCDTTPHRCNMVYFVSCRVFSPE